ncbi:MAG TPA: hypothetical protein PKC18_00420 [Lacipirellulaceae bacterium]|nr:hypothetical protein [Lacipirellulaceae bacterium]
MRINLIRSAAVVFVMSGHHAVATAQSPVDFSRTLASANASINVNFRAWAPATPGPIRGAVFSLPGVGGDARGIATNPNWRGKLTALGYAVVGNQFSNVPGDWDYQYWGVGYEQTASNMQHMLDGMAVALARPEIANAPVILDGHSHGAFGVLQIMQAIPERVLGYIADKEAYDLNYDARRVAVSKVPGLYVVGDRDAVVPGWSVTWGFSDSRDYGAPTALQVDWAGHQATALDTKFAFIDQIDSLRYPHGSVPASVPGSPLLPVEVSLADAWVGERNRLDYDDFPQPVVPLEWPQIEPMTSYQLEEEPWERSLLLNKTMALVYRAHNAVPAGISRNALQLTPANAPNGSVVGGEPIKLNLSLTETSFSRIDVFHDDHLIATLPPSAGVQQVMFHPTERGIHTFVAVAEYEYGGLTRFTSKYTTVGVPDVPRRLVADFDQDLDVDGHDFLLWQRGQSPDSLSGGDLDAWRGSFGARLDMPGDLDRNALVDGADFLAWQRGLSNGPLSTADLEAWKQNFGGLHVAVQPIPEPGAVLIAFAAAAWLCTPSRRRAITCVTPCPSDLCRSHSSRPRFQVRGAHAVNHYCGVDDA